MQKPLLILLCSFLFISVKGRCQEEKNTKKKFGMEVLKDSLDGKLDMSDFLIDFHGFIPVPQIITEPALGSIGGVITPIFIQPNKHRSLDKFIPPDVTAAFAGYSANKSWGVGAMRIASLPQYHLKYRAGIVHGDVNMDYYRTIALLGERRFSFNLKANAVFLSVLRQIGKSQLYAGIDYSYAHINVKPNFQSTNLPDFVTDKDISSSLSTLGPELQYDVRDNVFTPNSGMYLLSSYRINASWTGSDHDFSKLNIAGFKFFQPNPKWVSGFRLEGLWQFGSPPFYSKPYIDMRGVPMSRYQGDQVYMVETEQRYDFSLRWSGILFGGLAKAPSEEVSFNDATLVHNIGTGIRYLIARKFHLRTGVDVAWSNNDFGWYIIFGHAWNNRN